MSDNKLSNYDRAIKIKHESIRQGGFERLIVEALEQKDTERKAEMRRVLEDLKEPIKHIVHGALTKYEDDRQSLRRALNRIDQKLSKLDKDGV